MIRAAIRARWNVARLLAAAVLLWVLVGDTPARLARLHYASLPEFDAAAEVRFLRAAGRYGEAIMVADAAIESAKLRAKSSNGDGEGADSAAAGGLRLIPPDAAALAELETERAKTIAEQSSYLRRATDLGMGAISGTGGSLEGLVGAVAADFFIVGDVRDLVIQGGRLVLDGETDEVILVLSGVGLATTLAPEIDWVPSILKTARKAGTLTKGLSAFIIRSIRGAKFDELRDLLLNVRTLARRASPGGAVRLLAHADDPADVARLARFVENQPAGAFALHVTSREGATLLKAADAATPAAKAATEQAVVLAARKGTLGTAWLRTGAWKRMLKPHALVGVAKMLYKGNAEDLARRIAAAIDPRARWLIPVAAAWVFVEIVWLGRKVAGGRRAATQ
ncbi:MAG: hypothetical protein ACKVU4_05020 [Phycisphaerales bacterium]